MIRYFLTTFLLLASFCPLELSAQPVQQAAIAIGTRGNDGGNEIIRTTDNGYAVTGYTACSTCPADVYLFKLDSNYNLKWALSVGGSNDDYGFSTQQTYDSGYIISGLTKSYAGIYLIKINSSGNLLWTKTLQGGIGYSVVQTLDKGFAIAGYISTCNTCNSQACIFKLDSIGNLKWAETIGGNSNDTAYAIIQTADKGYAVAGTTSSFGAGRTDAYILKLDSVGNIEWSKTIGGLSDDIAYSIIQTTDKGFALTGYSLSYGGGGKDVYAIKLDSAGNFAWSRTLGGDGNDIGKCIKQTTDRGYIISGTSGSTDLNEAAYFIKLDSLGNFKWSRAVLGGVASSNSIVQTKEGNYVSAGTTSFFGAGESDVYILILDSNGGSCFPYDSLLGVTSIDSGLVNTGGTANSFNPTVSVDPSFTDTGGIVSINCSPSKPTSILTPARTASSIIIFPNPATANIYIQYNSAKTSTSNISITDVTGKILNTFSLNSTAGANTYSLPISNLALGMYFIDLNNGGSTIYSKFIKE